MVWLSAVAGFLVLLVIYGWFVEPELLMVRREVVRVFRPGLRRPVRILFLSDFQVGRLSSSLRCLSRKLARLRRVHEREPFDFILLGGDYIDADRQYLGQFEELLAEIAGFKVPVYAVLGNHDHYSFGYDEAALGALVGAMTRHGVALLRNAGETWRDQVAIVGLEDIEEASAFGRHSGQGLATEYVPLAGYVERAKNVPWYAALDTFHPELPRVLLTHNPDGVWALGLDPDLVIAGHTHGGAVFLLDWLSRPLWRVFYWFMPSGSFAGWAGRRMAAGRTLVVGRGIGGSGLPYRLGRPPEAVVVTLQNI